VAPAANSLASRGSMALRTPSSASARIFTASIMISYNPNNKDEGGFHQISVQVAGRKDLKVRTRPGYFLAALVAK
jgi:hypothetical protein